MSVESDLYTALTGDGTISGLVSTRIYPVVLPDNVTYPAIAYFSITMTPQGSSGFVESRIQTDLYATTYSELKSLRDAVQALCEGRTDYTFFVGPESWEMGTEVYHQSLDIVIQHS